MCVTLRVHLNSHDKFSLAILDPDSEFIKLSVEKVNSHTLIVPNILKSFPITDLSISFEF